MFPTINISEIDTSGRLRPADPAYVEALAASIEERGLDQPIKVRPCDSGYALVFGLHRLEALKLLGWTELQPYVHYSIDELSDDAARLAEIDENLMRHELTALDRAIFLLERKRVYEKMHPQTINGKNAKRGAKKALQSLQSFLPPRFTVDAANKVGLSSRSIHLAVGVASRLDPAALDALRKTPLADNQAALQKFAEETPENQRLIAAKMASDGIASLAEAKDGLGIAKMVRVSPAKRDFLTLIYLWQKADKISRAAFMKFVELERLGKATETTPLEIAHRIFPNESNPNESSPNESGQ